MADSIIPRVLERASDRRFSNPIEFNKKVQKVKRILRHEDWEEFKRDRFDNKSNLFSDLRLFEDRALPLRGVYISALLEIEAEFLLSQGSSGPVEILNVSDWSTRQRKTFKDLIENCEILKGSQAIAESHIAGSYTISGVSCKSIGNGSYLRKIVLKNIECEAVFSATSSNAAISQIKDAIIEKSSISVVFERAHVSGRVEITELSGYKHRLPSLFKRAVLGIQDRGEDLEVSVIIKDSKISEAFTSALLSGKIYIDGITSISLFSDSALLTNDLVVNNCTVRSILTGAGSRQSPSYGIPVDVQKLVLFNVKGLEDERDVLEDAVFRTSTRKKFHIYYDEGSFLAENFQQIRARFRGRELRGAVISENDLERIVREMFSKQRTLF
ncbi:TPA: hypothetical protein H1011_02870 [archaeon]|jgi:hypothetical protein|uniref:Uncharacterized protein n=1 Tax=Candidatus Undinarchaeum marinum TaxID=2756141 RepID=A0A832V2C5_9ARCH|nr:hypothetical protein [Candidatus Undinarchaeum marinum]